MTAERDGRGEGGRFTKGNKGGPGNPFMRRVAAMRREVAESFEEGQLAPLMRMIMTRALQGDMAAARLVLEYTVGRPGQSADPDTLDVEDIAIRRRHAITAEDIESLFAAFPARLLCIAAEAALPFIHEKMARQIAEQLKAEPNGTAGQTETNNAAGR